MAKLIVETIINAAPKICFDLIRRASAETNEQKTNGAFDKGQIVVFYNSFLGFEQNLTVKVSEFNRPYLFIDEMTTGKFESFRHIHRLRPENNLETLLTDIFEWTSPYGIFGKVFDELFLRKRLRKIVVRRNLRLRELVEIETGTIY